MHQALLAQRRAEYVGDLQRALDRIVSRLASMAEVECVILFGSYASGRRDLFTDLDLLVVMSSPLDYIHRTADLYQQLEAGVDLDLLVYTPTEFEQQRDRGFLRWALQTGRILYERGRSAGG